jgi:heat-inducible transcriptional repressor
MSDAVPPSQLTERQEKILALVIRTYVTRPEPVGSKSITEMGLNVSSATIRNEMVVLEELGFLSSPHTSAGRIPTETGYRYFVRRLLDDFTLSEEEQRTIADTFQAQSTDLESGLKSAVSTIARTVHGAALVTKPQMQTIRQFKHIELISTQGRMVLLVMVLYGGEVRQQMLTLAEPVSQEVLSAVANYLNQHCDKFTADQLRLRARATDTPLEREILEVIAETMGAGETFPAVAYREGLTEMFTESGEGDAAFQAIRLLEQNTLLGMIVSEAFSDPHLSSADDIQVVIGGEGRWQEVRHLSLVLMRYGTEGQVGGILGVLGPTRMRYGRAIASVRYVGGLINGMISEMYGDVKP